MSNDEVVAEQSYVDRLYARLDDLRVRTRAELTAVRRAGPVGTHQNRSERDSFATLHELRLAQLEAVEDRLAFGRVDLRGGDRRYIGRLGLADEAQDQLLVDWRAPAAREFYQATAASPGEVVRRRHLATRGRRVTGVEDEALDLDSLDAQARGSLTGEGALLAAVTAHRTGRMGDIVATIQAEQDTVIRSELAGPLVVQGGPGTGKTAVALHRAAYLLYTYRDRLMRSGVLLVGPNAVFLRYIEQVLPSLGETGVVLATPADLFPGVTGVVETDPEVAAVKGDLRMARVLARAVRARQRVPNGARVLAVGSHRLSLTSGDVATARSHARRTGKPHNEAREGFLRDLLDLLARRLAGSLGIAFSTDNREGLIEDLRESKDVRRELHLAWLPVSPQPLLRDLFADPARLGAAAEHELTRREQALLHRPAGAPWTVADVPLLDELAELLGDITTSDRAAADAAGRIRRAEDLDNARLALGNTENPMGLTAEALADRFTEWGPVLSVSERAGADRSWAFGHLVVDEAQELSPMTWRLLMRRCPTRSMTLVGDVAQVGSAAGASSWAEVLDPYVPGRWRIAELTVNYRTPTAVMHLASAVLAAAGIEAPTPESVRDGDWPPTAQQVRRGDVEAVAAVVRHEMGLLGEGRLAVVTAAWTASALHDELAALLPPGAVGSGASTLDRPVSVLSVAEVKGLEFDAVLLIEPADIVAASPRGINDLYVALTRPTQRLRVLHSDPLPAGLEALERLEELETATEQH